MTVWLVAVLIVVAAAAVQAATGFGFALVALPVLTLVFGTRDGIVLNLLLSAATNVWVAWRTRHDAVDSLVRPLVMGGLVGLIPGIAAFYLLRAQVLGLAIGLILLCAVALRLIWPQMVIRHSRRASVATGAVSGVLTGSIGIGGPPLSLYLSGGRLDKRAYRATSARYLLALNAVNLPMHAIGLRGQAWSTVGVGACAVVFIPVGAALGQALFTRMNQRAFDRLAIVIIVLAALTAVYHSISAGGLLPNG